MFGGSFAVHGVLFGSVLAGSFLGGVVALLAPSCVSVMLPPTSRPGFAGGPG